MRLSGHILPLALVLAVLSCTGGGFAGAGKAEKEEDAGEDKKGDKPVDVAGSFLVCGADEAKQDGEDAYGCAAVDGASKKRLASAKFTRLELVVDGKRRKAAPMVAPSASFWHVLFSVPSGSRLESVNATGDFASAGAPSATVDYRKPALGQESDGVLAIEPPPPPPPPTDPSVATSILIFATSKRFSGNLDGLSGADDKCNAAAKAGGLPGQYEALLSAAPGRVVGAMLTRGPEMFQATNWHGAPLAGISGSLLGVALSEPVAYDEGGNRISRGAPAWTGTDPLGAPAILNCGGWKSSSEGEFGVVGFPREVEPTAWLAGDEAGCDVMAHLYCVSTTPIPY